MKKVLEVVAALLWNENKFFIAKRSEERDLGGLWEFPGGKVEEGESPESAISRECEEELGISVEVAELFMKVTHDYGDKVINLALFSCKIKEGTPLLLEHQKMEWISVEEIPNYDFCPADLPFLEKLHQEGNI